MSITYRTIEKIKDPILITKKIKAKYGEIVDIELPDGEVREGKIIDIDEERTVIEVFKGTGRIDIKKTSITPKGKTATFECSPLIIGNIFSGGGKLLTGKKIYPEEERDINGFAINPILREVPSEFIQTGISAIDCLNSIVRGQKIAIFSGAGMPHYKLAAQIVRQAKLLTREKFVIILCCLGVTHEIADFLIKNFEETDSMKETIIFLNKAEDPTIETIIAPRLAMTTAEYLAFDLDMHILVLLIDVLNYANALREISASKEEIPTRRGYPSYLFSDLASIFERCGRIRGKKGSITLVPILTMPNDDITHPVPDLTGYITEGQIIFDRDMYKRGIYPPIDILSSLSRLMHKWTGGVDTKFHMEIANQIYSSYSEGKKLQETASILGMETLTEKEKKYIEFVENIEDIFINQEENENRTITETIRKALDCLKILPTEDLYLLSEEIISQLKS